jgi:hypothetical protein
MMDRKVAANRTKPRRLTWSRGTRDDGWFCNVPNPAYDQSQRGMGLIGFETGNQNDAIPQTV